MIGKRAPREPSQSRLTACQLPPKGELFLCGGKVLPVREFTPSVKKKVAQKRPQAFLSHKL